MKNLLNISEAANIAIHALAYMGGKESDHYFSATEIAKVLKVSESHLAKVMQKLVKTGFINSSRGAKGGFSLVKSPHDISLLDILVAIDGPLPQNTCLLGVPICEEGACKLSDMLSEVVEKLSKFLGEVKLASLKVKNDKPKKNRR